MNLSELRDLIRAEADIEGLETKQNLIDFLINQELLRLTGKAPFQELRTSVTFTSPANETHSFDLPDDYQLFCTLQYTPNANSEWESTQFLARGDSNGYFLRTMGSPQYWTRMGNTLKVYPYTEFYLNDTLDLVYYKKITLLDDADLLPVESLAPAVQQSVMARLTRTRDSRRSLIYKQEAKDAFNDSRAQNAGN